MALAFQKSPHSRVDVGVCASEANNSQLERHAESFWVLHKQLATESPSEEKSQIMTNVAKIHSTLKLAKLRS